MKKIQNILILLPIALIVYLLYKIAVNSFTDDFLGSKPRIAKAVIINEKNFLGNRSFTFNYSYQFEVNGVIYTGNSHDESLKVGDTILIEYNKEHPIINKNLNAKN